MFGYLRKLIKNGNGESSKSFSLVLSTILGGLIGLSVCFILIWDVVVDGVISTDLGDLGMFLMCTGIYMMGGGASKVISEGFEKRVKERFRMKKGLSEENGEEFN